MCFAPQRRALFRHRNFQKCSEPVSFLHFWRHNGVHFFDILTSKSAMNPAVFYTFDFKMCFAPRRRALFRHFSTSQLQKVLQGWGVLYILTWNCTSCHNGAHFFDIATSKSAPKLRCFVHFDLEMWFAPQRRATFHLSSDHMAPHPPL